MKRIRCRAAGFTLLELLVVILVVAVLVAVAAPSFLGQTGKAHDSAASQQLAVAYKAAKAASIDNSPQGDWGDPGNLAEAVADSEPELSVAATDSYPAEAQNDGRANLYVFVGSGQLQLRALSGSGQGCLLTAAANGGPSISCSTLPSVLPPQMLYDPTFSGDPDLSGDTLSVDTAPDEWIGDPTIDYQWQVSHSPWQDIAGETSSSYVVQPADVSGSLRVRVTASGASGTTIVYVSPSLQDKRKPKPKPNVPPVPLNTANLVSYWRLNDSGTTAVDAKGGHNGTYTGIPTSNKPTRGQAGPKASSPDKAVKFFQQFIASPADWRAQYIQVPYSSAHSATSFSVAAWVKFDAGSMGREAYLVGHLSTDYPTSGFFLEKGAGDQLIFAIGATTSSIYQASTPGGSPVSANTWYHVVGTYDSPSRTLQIYLNGALAGSNTHPSFSTFNPAAAGTVLRLGARADTNSDYQLQPTGLNGTLDEVAYFSGVLTPTQVLAQYNAYKP